MGYRQFSEEFKKSAIQKVLLRGNKNIEQACAEVGISSPTFYEWRRMCANTPGMKNSERRPQDWNAAEKFKAVLEYEALTPEKHGEFLRKSGLHSEHIAGWKKNMQSGLESSGKLSTVDRSERAQDRQKIKELEKELNRKDKALAETAALLILKKKADLIWGTGENE